MDNIVFIFCSYSIFRFKKEFTQSALSEESGSYFVRSEYPPSFSLLRSTYGKFILILVSPTWISLACVCCSDRWLLVTLLKIFLIMLSRYPFSFNTCFILTFSLCKSSLFMIMEYALLNKEETTLSLQLVWWWSCSLGIGQYAQASYMPMQRSLDFSVSI